MKPDRDPVASDQIHLVTVFGLCVSERVDRGVGRHPEPSRLKISNYFCLGTYRRQRSRLGAPKAITATAHKLARLVYSLLKHGSAYVKQGLDDYESQYRERK